MKATAIHEFREAGRRTGELRLNSVMLRKHIYE
jgi:hypothetical protein